MSVKKKSGERQNIQSWHTVMFFSHLHEVCSSDCFVFLKSENFMLVHIGYGRNSIHWKISLGFWNQVNCCWLGFEFVCLLFFLTLWKGDCYVNIPQNENAFMTGEQTCLFKTYPPQLFKTFTEIGEYGFFEKASKVFLFFFGSSSVSLHRLTTIIRNTPLDQTTGSL